jgi:hypothetical protein
MELGDGWGTVGGRLGDGWGTVGGRLGNGWGTVGGRLGDGGGDGSGWDADRIKIFTVIKKQCFFFKFGFMWEEHCWAHGLNP